MVIRFYHYTTKENLTQIERDLVILPSISGRFGHGVYFSRYGPRDLPLARLAENCFGAGGQARIRRGCLDCYVEVIVRNYKEVFEKCRARGRDVFAFRGGELLLRQFSWRSGRVTEKVQGQLQRSRKTQREVLSPIQPYSPNLPPYSPDLHYPPHGTDQHYPPYQHYPSYGTYQHYPPYSTCQHYPPYVTYQYYPPYGTYQNYPPHGTWQHYCPLNTGQHYSYVWNICQPFSPPFTEHNHPYPYLHLSQDQQESGKPCLARDREARKENSKKNGWNKLKGKIRRTWRRKVAHGN